MPAANSYAGELRKSSLSACCGEQGFHLFPHAQYRFRKLQSEKLSARQRVVVLSGVKDLFYSLVSIMRDHVNT